MSMKPYCVLAAAFLLSACQPEASTPAQDAPAADAAPETGANAASGSSTASWSGKHSNGTLSFDSAECTLMNGRIIFFTAPAGAEENVYPQMSGTHTRDAAWVVNILQAQDTESGFAGNATATAESVNTLSIGGTLIDGPAVAAQKEIMPTVDAQLKVTCTAIDDLGSF